MLHLIGKNLWARRYRNGWLLAELIIISMVIWVLTDPIVVTTHDRGLPTGITEEGMYRLNLAAVSSKSALSAHSSVRYLFRPPNPYD
jgi:putative ABC transport system permease protein